MKKRIIIFLCALIIVSMFPISASADLGPKPSVTVEFENMGEELCYGTLLSETEFFGPYSVWDGDEEHIYNYDLDIDIWRKFVEYKDQDGFVFLQIAWNLSEEKAISWTYYPPTVFKILLYYPKSDTFVVSEIYERYAFDSYFTVDMEGVDIGYIETDSVRITEDVTEDITGDVIAGGEVPTSALKLPNAETGDNKTGGGLVATRSYDYGREIGSLIARIILTIIIEMVIALIFGFVEKKQILLLICVNSVTQIILNVLLNIINYRSGEYALMFFYVLLELAIFVIEAIAYGIFLNKLSEKKRGAWVYVLYAFFANALSFALGMYLISFMIPGIF